MAYHLLGIHLWKCISKCQLVNGSRFGEISPECRIYVSVNWVSIGSINSLSPVLFGAKALPEPMLTYCQLDFRNKLQWNLNQNPQFFIHRNTFENVVCKLVAILSRGNKLRGRIPAKTNFMVENTIPSQALCVSLARQPVPLAAGNHEPSQIPVATNDLSEPCALILGTD